MPTETRPSHAEAIELRLAEAMDLRDMLRVADRDTRGLPPGPHLVALRNGRVDAVLSLSNGEAVADPFRPTADLLELLRLHARAVSAPPRDGGANPVPLPRVRPVTA